MTASKYNCSLNKKLNSERDAALSSLRKENTYLNQTVAELYSQYSQPYKLMERFLSLEMLRLKSSLQAEDEPLRQNKGSSVDGDSASCKQSYTTGEEVTELRNQLEDVLEKNQQWLEYDQQREAYVKAILNRMSWLENQLNEANQARSQRHNEAHSDEKERMSQMQDHYERLLQRAKVELEVLREKLDVTRQDLMITQSWCKEKEEEVEELRQQLESERKSKAEQDDHDGSELSDESEDLQTRLDVEKRRSDSFGLQAEVLQKAQLCHQGAPQKKIKDLQRQGGQQAHSSYQEVHPKSEFTTGQVTSSPQWNLLDESFLECPKCQVEYPASRYRELLNHIDICLA